MLQKVEGFISSKLHASQAPRQHLTFSKMHDKISCKVHGNKKHIEMGVLFCYVLQVKKT